MRPGKLYVKIVLSFFAVFFITLVIVFALFLAIPGKQFSSKLTQYTNAKALILKEVVEDKIRSAPTRDLSKNEPLKEFLKRFGEILGAKVWLQSRDGTLQVKSFQGDIPEIAERLRKRRPRDFGNVKLYQRRHFEFYAVIPMAFPEGQSGSLHVLFDKQGPEHPERGFALGLAVVGLIIALLIIPVSRFITKPLKELTQSALRIAEGDFSKRPDVRCKDEIGELCASFNHMADKVERMIQGGKELTANISHELRSPLARIRIAEELIREKLSKADYGNLTRHMDDIREDIGELDHLIGQILDLSKLDLHESPFRFERLELYPLLEELLDKYRPVMDKGGLRLITELVPGPPVSGDKEALRRALSNILDNAVKFTPEKGEIRIQMVSEGESQSIEVTNACEELSEDQLSGIFEPFFRLKKSEAKGSGLGLSITKKIIEKHGGSIEAVNRKEGLCVRMRFPGVPPAR